MAAARGEKRPTLDAEDGNHAKKPRGKKGKGKGTGKAKGKSTPNQNTGASGANGSEAVDPDTAPGVGAPEVGPDGDVAKTPSETPAEPGDFDHVKKTREKADPEVLRAEWAKKD